MKYYFKNLMIYGAVSFVLSFTCTLYEQEIPGLIQKLYGIGVAYAVH